MAPKWIHASPMTYLLQDAGVQLPQVTVLSRRIRTLELGPKNAPVCSNIGDKQRANPGPVVHSVGV